MFYSKLQNEFSVQNANFLFQRRHFMVHSEKQKNKKTKKTKWIECCTKLCIFKVNLKHCPGFLDKKPTGFFQCILRIFAVKSFLLNICGSCRGVTCDNSIWIHIQVKCLAQNYVLFPLMYVYGGKSSRNPFIPMGISVISDVPTKLLPSNNSVRNFGETIRVCKLS